MTPHPNFLHAYLAGEYDEAPERPLADPGRLGAPGGTVTLPPHPAGPLRTPERPVARPLVTTRMRLLAWVVLNSPIEESPNARALAEAVLGDDVTFLGGEPS
jgi:hypothetical protein